MATTTRSAGVRQRPAPEGAARAFRGLALVFVLSFLSLAGVMLTVGALGGLEPWTAWQFVGVFGLIEVGSGLANIFSPNIWRLPIAQAQTSRRTSVKLAASAMAIPHWGGAARAMAGATLLLVSAANAGAGPGTLLVAPLVLLVAVSVTAGSAIIARLGVARPDLDVVQLVIRRGGREHELEPLSIGASALQFALSIATIPFVEAFAPGVMFRPEMAPSPLLFGGTVAVTLALVAGAVLLWRGRIDWHAPREQQKEAEKYA